MGRSFGTDGMRGIANRDLSIRCAGEWGLALAELLRGEHLDSRPKAEELAAGIEQYLK